LNRIVAKLMMDGDAAEHMRAKAFTHIGDHSIEAGEDDFEKGPHCRRLWWQSSVSNVGATLGVEHHA
jgi:hypothetical protein